ncbi:MAG: aminotransferase class V-fold PLP-dependent enzyme [Chloroflexi bacterium]|nr:aminotransferase class V-fold PLP-dependent enzyme [Chloroflexota bacterium]
MTDQTATYLSKIETLRGNIVGIDRQVPLLDGSMRTYTYLDNAASTPSLRQVQDTVSNLLPWYSSVHRGAGWKSLISSRAYEHAHEVAARFVGADPQKDVVIFGKNTTEAINTLANVIDWKSGDVVITTLMEHHSDDLPWRNKAHVVHVGVDPQGRLDLAEMEKRLKEHSGKIRLVAVTGASNVTGFVPPVHQIAEMAHQAGALILVDAAQLAPHRVVDMGPHGTSQHLDFVALSGHKIYAPYGAGALVGPKAFFANLPPDYRGGGTIEVVTVDEVHWAEPPERDEAGSPNVIGAVALAASLEVLSGVGMEVVEAHERELTAYALEKLAPLPGVRVYGSADPQDLDDRLGVISFDVAGVPHAKVAAVLAFEGGIGVRDGCFCAHPYILHLLQVEGEVYRKFKDEVLSNDRRNLPGLVRASFGCYNTTAEVDHLVEMLQRIAAGKYFGDYIQERNSGSYFPRGYDPAMLDGYFHL